MSLTGVWFVMYDSQLHYYRHRNQSQKPLLNSIREKEWGGGGEKGRKKESESEKIQNSVGEGSGG
jgi:hypothetical protein